MYSRQGATRNGKYRAHYAIKDPLVGLNIGDAPQRHHLPKQQTLAAEAQQGLVTLCLEVVAKPAGKHRGQKRWPS
jgi:hypothetical protein